MEDKKTLMVNTLKHIRKYPSMYFVDSLTSGDNFLAGFFVAVGTFTNIEDDSLVYERLLKKHGLVKNRSIIQQFQEQGLSADAAIQATLTIYIESFEQSQP